MHLAVFLVITIQQSIALNLSQVTTDSGSNQGVIKQPSIYEVLDRIQQLEVSSKKDREIIDALEASSDEYRKRIKVFESSAVEDRAKISALETASIEDHARISTLEIAMIEDRKNIETLQTKLTKCILLDSRDRKVTGNLNNSLESRTSIKDNLTSDYKNIEDSYASNTTLRTTRNVRATGLKRGTTGVAFSASMSSSIRTPNSGHVMIFNRALTNIGNAYNPTTGVFTCPQSGTYFFAWNVRVSYHYGGGILNKNGARILEAFTSDDIKYSQEGSSAAVVQLRAGDTLTIRVSNPQYVDFTTPASFSGFSIL